MAKEASHRNLYFAATVACLTGVLFGYSVGFIGGILVLPSFLHGFHLDELPPELLASATSATVSVWLVGALVGVPLGMPVCSRWGRRKCLTFSALLYVSGAVMQMCSSASGDLGLFDGGRLLNGLGVGAGTLVSPMYISEISLPAVRGMLLSGYQTAIQLAALAGFWAAFAAHSRLPDSSSAQWLIPVTVQLVPGFLVLLGTCAIPESPRFLAQRGKIGAAKDAVAWLRCLPREHKDVLLECDELEETCDGLNEAQRPESSFFVQVRKNGVRRRLVVGIGLMIAQNMVGLNALNYYAPIIFMSSGFTSVSASLFLTGIFGVIKVLSALSFMFVFVHLRGNRFWLKLGSAICGISMLVLALSIRHMPSPPSPKSGITADGLLSVAMVYLFAFAFGISLGPLSWNICSEIFPAGIKAQCCAITTCVQWLFQIIIAGITPHLIASVGWVTYLVYAGFCGASFVWVAWCVPETKGVALGRPMDDLFDAADIGEDDNQEVSDITPLLGPKRIQKPRRDSVSFSV